MNTIDLNLTLHFEMEMRVLFLGHTGIIKRKAVENLALGVYAHQELTQDLDNVHSRKFLRVFHLEDEILNLTGGNYIPFLDTFNAKSQLDQWTTAWEALQQKITESDADNVFVTLHATYFRQNRFFSALNFEKIEGFNPDVIVTLIDDIQDCWSRINEREIHQPQGTNLRLRDIILWRTVEIMAGDFLKRITNSRHFVLAVKHPVEMARRLLFEGSTKRIYASFPISSTRSFPERRALIDEFRIKLHEKYAVFDPLTIDERTIRSAFERVKEGAPLISIEAEDRWPLTYPDGFSPLTPSDDIIYPLEIPVDQVDEALIDIDKQIRSRDFRLIDQVNAVAAFRPSMNGHHSRGVSAELQYAGQTVAIPIHMLWDSSEDGPFGDSPFSDGGVQHANLEDLLSALG